MEVFYPQSDMHTFSKLLHSELMSGVDQAFPTNSAFSYVTDLLEDLNIFSSSAQHNPNYSKYRRDYPSTFPMQ